MKQHYVALVLLACIALENRPARAQTTAWRPFRPGFVYSFGAAGSSGTTSLHTLRVDSAYATASGDSVYTFNRLLRLANGSTYQFRKSRNNLLGARLRWQPGTHNFYLEANAEPLTGTSTAVTLLLRPHAAVGSTWLASTTPALTATLSGRTLGTVGATTDSLATISLSNGQQVVLSKRYGLVSGPQWLALATAGNTVALAVLADLPQAGLGAYDPRKLFGQQAGAVLGYSLDKSAFLSGFTCASGYRLRRLLTRTQTADSLVFTYQEQERATYYPVPVAGCSGQSGTITKPVRTGRWAFSLLTGRSPQFQTTNLLSYEYYSLPSSSTERLWYNAGHVLNTASSASQITYLNLVAVYGTAGAYQPLVDNQQTLKFATTIGLLAGNDGEFYFQQAYLCPAGVTCPPPSGYTDLLPTRAALAQAAASLHPNPARDLTTLTLASPAPAGTTLVLTDALGRQLWSETVTAGQTTLPVPLAGRPAGLYLVQLQLPGQPVLTYKTITAD